MFMFYFQQFAQIYKIYAEFKLHSIESIGVMRAMLSIILQYGGPERFFNGNNDDDNRQRLYERGCLEMLDFVL